MNRRLISSAVAAALYARGLKPIPRIEYFVSQEFANEFATYREYMAARHYRQNAGGRRG